MAKGKNKKKNRVDLVAKKSMAEAQAIWKQNRLSDADIKRLWSIFRENRIEFEAVIGPAAAIWEVEADEMFKRAKECVDQEEAIGLRAKGRVIIFKIREHASITNQDMFRFGMTIGEGLPKASDRLKGLLTAEERLAGLEPLPSGSLYVLIQEAGQYILAIDSKMAEFGL